MEISISTGSGFWNPIVWLIALLIALLITYAIRSLGRKDYKRGKEQIKPFLSGNAEEDVEKLHTKGDNLYWGFRQSLAGYYKLMQKIHSGDLRDYVVWFVVILVILSFVVFGVM
ncbi:MAG TPA: hydrogenase [Thermoplasmatales archaeon]|nr:hydrogenase [Thermoplasmatales archaeon]